MSLDVAGRIKACRLLRDAEGPDGASTATRRALADRHHVLVAQVAGDRLLCDLAPDLIAACGRFLDKPVKKSPPASPLRAALDARGDERLSTRFAQIWGDPRR